MGNAIVLGSGSGGSGNMKTSVYDADKNGIIDDAERLGGIEAAEYVLKTELPESTNQNVIDCSEMFDFETGADVSAFFFRRNSEDGKGLVKLHGYDNSGGSNDLEITPALGFGPHYDAWLAQAATEDGTDIELYGIQLKKDNGINPGKIIVPAACNTFDISYYASLNMASYYVKTDGSMHSFELDNTPIANFTATGYNQTTFIINGQSVNITDIREISFGKSYLAVDGIVPNNFLYGLTQLKSIDLYGLGNVDGFYGAFLGNCTGLTGIDLNAFKTRPMQMGYYFLNNCAGLKEIDLGIFTGAGNIPIMFLNQCTALTGIDLSPLSEVENIGYDFMTYCTGMSSLDLSHFGKLKTVGKGFYNGSAHLEEIHLGEVDWSAITVETGSYDYQKPFNGVLNTSACKIYAASQELGAAFKAKIGAKISNWTIVVD
jgi:hypothetical protein